MQRNGVHVVGTVLAAADRGARIDAGRLHFEPGDLRGTIRAGRESNLIVFLVDASGSVAGRTRLKAVSGAVESILDDAYVRRDKVAVISVRGSAPELLLPPTGSIYVARRRLDQARTGGCTPLAEGLAMADRVITTHYRKEPDRRAILIVLTDGRATGPGGLARAYRAADAIVRRKLTGSIVIDCEQAARVRLRLAHDLAQHLGAPCITLSEMSADAVSGVIDTT